MISTKEDSISYKVAERDDGIPLIVDLYTPLLLEKEAGFSRWKLKDQFERWRKTQVVKKVLSRASHFLVANKKQKDYWLEASKSLKVSLKRNNISVLPTGAPPLTIDHSPFTSRRVILWFGGIYPWLDPEPLIEAFAQIAPKYPDWKLRILGGFHPKTGYSKIYNDVIGFAREKIDKNQLEIIPWQKLTDIGKYLYDVSFAVHLVKKTEEDYYAHRVRLLTLTEAKIPVLTNGKDVISEFIVKRKAGRRINIENLTNSLIQTINAPNPIKDWRKSTVNIQYVYINSQKELRDRFI